VSFGLLALILTGSSIPTFCFGCACHFPQEVSNRVRLWFRRPDEVNRVDP
jgi:hypothetical protein